MSDMAEFLKNEPISAETLTTTHSRRTECRDDR